MGSSNQQFGDDRAHVNGMVRITEELLRHKAGPTGDAGLSELRELALHGLGIERLEYIGSRCRELRVLILQNNIIPHIENLQRLKVESELSAKSCGR